MKSPTKRKFNLSEQRGDTLIGFLVAALVGTFVITATASSFTTGVRSVWDRITIAEANNQARTLSHLISSDLRVIGSGMPLGSPRFHPFDPQVGDAALPILPYADATNITYRVNKSGRFGSLTAPFDPSFERSFSVTSTDGFRPDSWLYISNISSEFSQSSLISGLRARIISVGDNSIGVSDVSTNEGAVFKWGSIAEIVDEVTLDCANVEGISRDTGSGPIILYPNSSCTITYLDTEHNELAYPLTTDAIQSLVSSIRFTISVPGRRRLQSGNSYTAQVAETVALRNIILARNQ
jgi:hypothetical protein